MSAIAAAVAVSFALFLGFGALCLVLWKVYEVQRMVLSEQRQAVILLTKMNNRLNDMVRKLG